MQQITRLLTGLYIGCAAISLFGLSSCKDDKEDPKYQTTDYSTAGNWLFVSGNEASKPVDIFFAYPTTYSGGEVSCAVTDPGMRRGARVIRESEATAYEESANLFMPYYRQVNAGHVLTLPEDQKDKLMRDIPAQDLLEAFRYYLTHYSNGRPFILAGHSQGSNSLLYVLEYIRSRPELLDRLVAAYIIGYSVTPAYLARNVPLRFAEGRTDTGVIISWNTESPGVTERNPVVEPGALAINPITWTTDESLAGADLSLGARIEQSSGAYVKKEYFADAQVNRTRGVIVCSTVDPEDYKLPIPVFPLGVLHGGDYPFYYYDLQQNVKDRVESYLRPTNP